MHVRPSLHAASVAHSRPSVSAGSSAMRSCLLALASLVLIQLLPSADASTCPSICATTTVYGFSAGGVGGCTCTGTGTSRSTSTCQCSICYVQTGTQVWTYSYSNTTAETCPFDGTDCSLCDDDSTSASSSTSSSKPTSSSSNSSSVSSKSSSTASSKSSSTTTTPTTSSPTPDTTTSTSRSSSSGSNVTSSAGSTAGASSTTDTSSGLQTWQIALIICSTCLLFIVIVVSLLTCYCRARRRLYENEGRDDDVRFYQRHYASGDAGAVNGAAAAGTGAAYSSSFPNRPDQFGPYTAGSSSVGLKPMPYGSDPAMRNSARSSTPSSEGTGGRTSRASTGGNGSELYVVGRTSGNGSELYTVNSRASGNGSELFATANYGSQRPSQEYLRASRSEGVEL